MYLSVARLSSTTTWRWIRTKSCARPSRVRTEWLCRAEGIFPPIIAKKMDNEMKHRETRSDSNVRVISGLYWGSGKENGNCYEVIEGLGL